MEVRVNHSKLGTIVSGIALAVLGGVVLSNPSGATVTVVNIVGWVLVIMGVGSLASAFTRITMIMASADLYLGVLELLFGILIINMPAFFVSWIFILLGFYVLYAGFAGLTAGNAATAVGLPLPRGSRLSSVLTIVLGVLMIVSPFTSASVAAIIAGVSLLFTGVQAIVAGIRMPSEKKRA